MRARLPAEIGSLFVKALDAAVECISTPGVPAGTASNINALSETGEDRPSRSARRADAFGALAESFVKHGGVAMTGGERHQIIVHVDAETLRNSTAGRCEIEEGPALHAETIRRLGCDCSVVVMLENELGEPLDVGRKTRSIPTALRGR